MRRHGAAFAAAVVAPARNRLTNDGDRLAIIEFEAGRTGKGEKIGC